MRSMLAALVVLASLLLATPAPAGEMTITFDQAADLIEIARSMRDVDPNDERALVYRVAGGKFKDNELDRAAITLHELEELLGFAVASPSPRRAEFYAILGEILSTDRDFVAPESVCTEPTTLAECESCCEVNYDQCSDHCSDLSGLARWRCQNRCSRNLINCMAGCGEQF